MNDMRKLMETTAPLFENETAAQPKSAEAVLDAVESALTDVAGSSWQIISVDRDDDAMEFTAVVMDLALEDDDDLVEDNTSGDLAYGDDEESSLDTALTKLEELDMVVAQVMDKDDAYAEVQDHIDQLRDLFMSYL